MIIVSMTVDRSLVVDQKSWLLYRETIVELAAVSGNSREAGCCSGKHSWNWLL